ncbi:MAG: NAD(P)H-hydrate dehydratase [Chitinophagaceae bacterium]|nr:NAD(P)H-hydrate dehydratase [Chitinophagaceae bacterium]
MNKCLEYIKGLSAEYANAVPGNFRITDETTIRGFIKKRETFSHKGDYGNGALIAGSEGMMGAAALCAMAFLRSGGGKLTCHIPSVGYNIIQTVVPEAMAKIEPGGDHIESVSSLDKYDVVGIGPGLGPYESNEKLLDDVLWKFKKPVVIDADALNTISRNKLLLKEIPHGSVLTPHAKEFERIFGETKNELDTIRIALKNATQYNIIIVVKGPYTLVATPGNIAHFNTTGNPGMATGGTGDVLTGVITGLIAQKYEPEHAAMLGVYLHGLAGDLAAADISEEALIAADVIDYLGKAYKTLH